MTERFTRHTFEVPLPCEYLLHAPESRDSGTLLVLTLHGYGSNPQDMLRLTVPAVGAHHVIAALRAPHQHYTNRPGSESPAAYNWGIPQHWSEAVSLHHHIVRLVLDRLGREFGFGPDKTVLAGFSQPVGLNYRFAATYPGQVGGVIGICGGVPRDWEQAGYHPMQAAVLHIARDEDEFYPVSQVEQFPSRLRKYASAVEFHLIPGRHRFPSQAGALIQPWLKHVFGGKPPDGPR